MEKRHVSGSSGHLQVLTNFHAKRVLYHHHHHHHHVPEGLGVFPVP